MNTRSSNTRSKLGWGLSLLFILATTTVFAQMVPQDVLDVTPFWDQNGVRGGSEVGLALQIDMAPRWHVYAPIEGEAFTIPIEPSLKNFEDLEWNYPAPEYLAVAGVEETAAVFGGSFTIATRVTVPNDLDTNFVIQGSVFFQACDDQQCLIPATVEFVADLPLLADAAQVKTVNANKFPGVEKGEPVAAPATEEDEIAALVNERGLFITFLLIFLGGLALNLTPCVYPLIPITISFFGGADVGKGKTFWMALAYVMGISITYSVLGVVAALGGGLFGTLLTNPIVLIVIALILVGLSLSMFGVYEFRVPSGLMMAAGKTKSGVFGALFMGLTLGIVAAPCVGPFVIGLLTYVATLQSVVMGFFMFFTLAMGLGLPYLFLAMFSSRISSLPRSGAWMIGVRVIFGFVLIIMAVYFLMPLFGEYGVRVLAASLFVTGFYLILVDRHGVDARAFEVIKQLVAIAAIIAGTWLAVPEGEPGGAAIRWEHPQTMEELESTLDSGKPVMIDFYADWCLPCREMDNITFPDPEIVNLSRQFTMIKIDLTRVDGQFEKRVQQDFRVKGVPTYLFMTAAGIELTHIRSSGFEEPEDFLQRMQAGL